MDEIWKPINNYHSLYEVSNMGRVRSLDKFSKHKEGGDQFIKGRILKHAYYSNGYCFVVLSKLGKVKQFMIHRLVAIAFHPNPKKLPEVNHKRGIKDDNRASELEWCTHKENVSHALRTGLINSTGKNNGFARSIIIEKDGIKIPFSTQREASKFLGVKDVNISSAKITGTKCLGYKIYNDEHNN